MQYNRFVPISNDFQNADYVGDAFPFEIRFAYNSFAPNLTQRRLRFEERTFKSETGSGDIIYYLDQLQESILMNLYRKQELFTLINDEVFCVKNNSFLYPFMASFAEGFTRGYFELKNNSEGETVERNVFNTAIRGSLCGLNNAYETYFHNGENKKFLTHELMNESGVKMGGNYKAWQIILDNPFLYLELFRTTEDLIGFYRWNLEREIEREDQRDTWGIKKGLEILLTHDIDPKLLEKVEQKMIEYGSLIIEDKKKIKDILKANKKDKGIANRYAQLIEIHKNQKSVLSIVGRSIDLNVGTEKSSEKNKTDSIKRTLKSYGIILEK